MEVAQSLTRPIVTILIVATMCFIAIRSNLMITSDQFITIAAMIIAFWFGQRTSDTRATDRRPPTVVNTENPLPPAAT